MNAILFLVPLSFLPGIRNVFELPKQAMFRILLMILLFLVVRKVVQVGKLEILDIFRKRRVKLMMLAFVALLFVGGVFSIAPRLSFWGSYFRMQGIYSFLNYLLFFLLLAGVMRKREDWEQGFKWLGYGLVVSVFYGFWQKLGFSGFDLEAASLGRVFSSFGHPNFFASYLVILFFPLMWRRKWILLGLAVLGIWMAGSRGAILGLGAGLMFYAFFYGLYENKKAFVALLLLPAVLGGMFLFGGGRLDFAGEALRSVETRTSVWKSATEMIDERIFTGYGMETFQIAFAKFADKELLELERIGSSPDKAHNTFVEMMASVGLLGLGLYLFILFGIFAEGLRSRKMEVYAVLSSFFAACVMYMVGFAVTSDIILMTFLLVYLAWLLSGGTVKIKASKLFKKVGIWVTGIFAVCSIIFISVFDVVADRMFHEGRYDIATLLRPEQSYYAYFYAGAGGGLETLERAGEFASFQDPYYYFLKGRLTGEEKYFEKAQELAPLYSPTLYHWGKLYVDAGECALAEVKFREYLALVPDDWRAEGDEKRLFYKHNSNFDRIFDAMAECDIELDNIL